MSQKLLDFVRGCIRSDAPAQTHSKVPNRFDPANPPSVPINPPAGKKINRATHVEKMSCGICFYSCVDDEWVLDFCCVTMDVIPPNRCGLSSAALTDSLLETDDITLNGNIITFEWPNGDKLEIEQLDVDPARPPVVANDPPFPVFFWTQDTNNADPAIPYTGANADEYLAASEGGRWTARFIHGDCEVDGCQPERLLSFQIVDIDFPGTVAQVNDTTTNTLASEFLPTGALDPTGTINEYQVQPGFGNTPPLTGGLGFTVDPANGHTFEGLFKSLVAAGGASEGVIFYAQLYRRDPVTINGCTGVATNKDGDVVDPADFVETKCNC